MKLMLSIALCPLGCNMEGQTHQFDKAGGNFGRAPDNHWVLPDPSRYVSSRHGSIRFENDQFLLIDESTNGIYLNGGSLPLGSAQQSVLKNGDLLVFGDYRIQVNIEEITNILSAESISNVDVMAVKNESLAASPVFIDDLDKWLEPSIPKSESVIPSKSSINILSSPLVQSANALDLGLKEEEKDPLALLGAVKKTSGLVGMSSSSASGSLTDLLGGASSIDQHMMNVPSVIPDDWDDLLGGPSSESLKSKQAKPVNLKPTPVANKILEPEPLDPDQTTYIEPIPTIEKSQPLASKQTPAAEVPKKLVSKAPEELGLSELLSTPQEMLQTERSTELSEDNLGDMLKVSDVSSLVPKEMPEPVNVERQSLKTGGGADLAKALGLERLSADQQNMLNETVANTVKETVTGMMRTLRARSEIKSEFRMNMTTIQSAENNPLKFSVTPDDAIENMFAKDGKAYLSPVDAMNDGFADISDHQVALFDAMKAAYEHILGQFDPSTLTRKFEKTTSKRFLGGGKGKNWDAYLSLFEEYKEDNELTFKRLFGEVFADAYERRMHSLKMNRSSALGKKSVK
jgi:type VI secretion system FHA domain protein